MTVTGTAAVGGAVDITTGYAVAIGDSFTIITSGGARTGAFTGAVGADLAGDISWGADYLPNSVVLRVSRPTVAIDDVSVAEGNAGTKLLDLHDHSVGDAARRPARSPRRRPTGRR